MRLSRRGLLMAASGFAFAARPRRAAGATAGSLGNAMQRCRFVSYQPTAIKVTNGKLSHADDESIGEDLKALRPWFDGLVTYSATNGAERVPDIAARLGFTAVVLGLFDIHNAVEYENMLAAVRRNGRIIVGCGVGNETVLSKNG